MTWVGPALDGWREGGTFPARERWAQVWAQPRTLLRATQPGCPIPIPTPTAKARAAKRAAGFKKEESGGEGVLSQLGTGFGRKTPCGRAVVFPLLFPEMCTQVFMISKTYITKCVYTCVHAFVYVCAFM